MKICNSFLAFREEELIRYKKGCSCGKTLGDYTTVNLTAMRAGVEDQEGRPLIAYNVIPTTAEAGFDIRIPASVPLESFKKRVEEWCSEEGATWELVANSHVSECTAFWLKAAGAEYDTALFPAATDSRFLRPMKNTPVLLHDHDEFIPVDVFLEGIKVSSRDAWACQSSSNGFTGVCGLDPHCCRCGG
ncbi:acy1 [Symbiodinium sp. KB8]|nr:acy1 [Symbiodinium sp. KB8]